MAITVLIIMAIGPKASNKAENSASKALEIFKSDSESLAFLIVAHPL